MNQWSHLAHKHYSKQIFPGTKTWNKLWIRRQSSLFTLARGLLQAGMLSPGGPRFFFCRKEASCSCVSCVLPTVQLREGSDLSFQNLHLVKESAETPAGIRQPPVIPSQPCWKRRWRVNTRAAAALFEVACNFLPLMQSGGCNQDGWIANWKYILVRRQGREIEGNFLLGEEIKYKNLKLNCHWAGILSSWSAV